MLTIFNRRLLTTTCSAKRLVWLRQTLDATGIRSEVRTPGQKAAERAWKGKPSAGDYYRYQYNIYVYREDYERAFQALRSARQVEETEGVET